MSWWQSWLLRIGWYFTKRAYRAGLGDKIIAEVRRIDDDPGTGAEKFQRVREAALQDIAELPGELKVAGVETADWALGHLINSAVAVERVSE